MRAILLTLFSFLILVPFSNSQAQDNITPNLYGVLFYADWCSSCAILEPSVEEAKENGNFDPQNIQFVRFDLSNPETQKEAVQIASMYGFQELLVLNSGRTGYLAIVSAEDGQILARMNKNYSSSEIINMINAEL